VNRVKPVRIHIEALTPEPELYPIEISPQWWQSHAGAAASNEKLAGPCRFDLRISKPGPDVLIEGEMSGVMDASCSRCDRRYGHRLREDLRLVLEPAGEKVPAEPESASDLARAGMCLGDELEIGMYRGEEIVLDRFLAEVIALALPMQPAPPLDPRGCCSECGIDCSAPIEAIEVAKPDSPFAVLAKLREGKPASGESSSSARQAEPVTRDRKSGAKPARAESVGTKSKVKPPRQGERKPRS
jgi:uncharacterized metal-binding protein YceD (DUF177 family)